MKLTRRLFLSFFYLLTLSVSGQLYTYKLYNRADGLSTQTIRCAAQDKSGYLYIGTDGAGLVRYDGYRFNALIDKELNVPMHVSQIAFVNNEVYFSTLFSGVCAYYNNTYHQIYHPSDSSGETVGISVLKNRLGVFCTSKIAVISLTGKELFKKRFNPENPLRYYQILNFPFGTIAFTSSGNYVITEKGILKLSDFVSSRHIDRVKSGTYSKGRLVLFDPENQKNHTYTFERNGQIKWLSSGTCSTNFFKLSNDKQFFASEDKLYYFGKDGLVKFIKNGVQKSLAPNYSFDPGFFMSCTEDWNRDLWVCSSQGLIKIGPEPFTKIELDPVYLRNDIGFIYKDRNGHIYISYYSGELNVVREKSGEREHYGELPVYDACETENQLFLATRKGVYTNQNNRLIPYSSLAHINERIQSLTSVNKRLYFAPISDGLYEYDFQSKTIHHYPFSKFPNLSHVYIMIKNPYADNLYLGTNEGVFNFDLTSGKLTFIRELKKLGSYVGNGTIDAYGTVWFSMDKGLGGITREGKIVLIQDINILKSVLTYTLNSDEYGNLYVGSNLGINILKLNDEGKVLSNRIYNSGNGFNGFETNIRASFTDKNLIYLGTVDGLYSINSELLENVPIPNAPYIFLGRLSPNGNIINDDKDRFLSFRNILPKNTGLYYSYRIIGSDTNWSAPSSNPELLIPKLENGRYSVQVRSSYDKIHFSGNSTFPLILNSPFWQSKWFIVILIVLLGFGNIMYIEWTSSGLTSRLGDFNHEAIDARFLPKLILFGAVVCILVSMIEHYLIRVPFSNITLDYITSSILIFCYLTSYILYRRTQGGIYLKYVFYFSLIVLASHYYLMVYLSRVHPYPVIATILLSTVLPYTITRLRTIIIICTIQVSISISILIAVDKTVYNEFLYITAIVVSAALTILITYLRNDSLEKLIFVSNILNRGDMIVIAFDRNGDISYVSKNIAEYFNVDTGLLIGKPLATLNPLVVTQEMRELSLAEEFRDGKVFLVPMYNKGSDVVWVELSCKEFSNEIKVIIGRDVTEKLTISTNYQSLVENAQDMIFNTDTNGNFIYLNEMGSRMFGYRNENLVGQNSINVVHPDYRQMVQEFYQNQFDNKIKHTYLEFPIRTKEGRIIWLGQNATMTFEPGSRKRVSGFIALARDITEKRANELLIEQQNRDITESINSAKRIQQNLLPKPAVMAPYFQDCFLIYKPKDIVSGDFYWFHERNGKFFVVLSDCTGHGIPGAFMTIMGINILNNLVIERKLDNPATIVNALHNELNELMHFEKNTELPEGMQILVCVFEKSELHFSSSGVTLVHTNGNRFEHYRSTKRADDHEHFSETIIPFGEMDQFYMITDGYQKQFGSSRNKKFSFKRVRELLERIGEEVMPLQKKYFENSWSNWSDGHEQTDDITIIGLKGFKNPALPGSEQE